ncbi:MAG: hypothetical protein IJX94_00705 [Clostridia bacterium]|nr:hypothetical protein [Clostridia bacterium]
MKKNVKKVLNNNKKPIIIGTIGAGIAALAVGLGKAIKSMKANAKAQREADKAEFEAAKAEAKANFEENRGHNTYAKAKADAKKSWDDAHMSPSERAAKEQEARDTRIAEAKARTEEANARYNAAKK